MKPVVFKAGVETRKQIRKIARVLKTKKSAAIRRAIERFAEEVA